MYCSPNIVRVIKARRLRWAGHEARMEENLTGKPIKNIPLGRPKLVWEENI